MKLATLLLLAFLPACTATTSQMASGGAAPAYQYADIFQVQRDDTGASGDWSGYGASGSIRVDERLHLFGEFYSVVSDSSPGDDIDVLGAGFGYHLPLAEHTDVVLDLGFIDEENEVVGSSASRTVLQSRARLRTRILGPLEMEVGATRYDYEDPDTDLELGAVYHLTDKFGVAVQLADGDQRGEVRFGARLHL